MISIVRQVLIRASQEAVSQYIHEIHHLADYEQKVDTCRVSYPEPGLALAAVTGKFMGLSWKGVFQMRFTPDGGFTSRMMRGPLKHMTGNFRLEPTHSGTVLTHQENYRLPWLVRPFYPIVAAWIASSMETEMAIIKQTVESRHHFSPSTNDAGRELIAA